MQAWPLEPSVSIAPQRISAKSLLVSGVYLKTDMEPLLVTSVPGIIVVFLNIKTVFMLHLWDRVFQHTCPSGLSCSKWILNCLPISCCSPVEFPLRYQLQPLLFYWMYNLEHLKQTPPLVYLDVWSCSCELIRNCINLLNFSYGKFWI